MLEQEVGHCDAVLLSPLSEDNLIHNLHIRFKRDIIYTYIGNMLISMNPCRQLPLYSAELVQMYLTRAPFQLPPHIYAIAATAYRWLRDRNENQCIVVTGESGAGKTEAARICLQCLVVAAASADTQSSGRGSSDGPVLRDRLTASGTVLEAFGNAGTERNHNASRFGKYLDIEFDFKGAAVGAHVTHYFLEKFRVSKLQSRERNFHIFYQLLAGADVHLLKTLKLQRNACTYRILRPVAVSVPDGITSPPSLNSSPHHSAALDREQFSFTKTAMECMGLTDTEMLNVFRIIASILKLGNLEFMPATNIDGTVGCVISNEYELYEVCSVLGSETNLAVALCSVGESEGGISGGVVEAAAALDRLLCAIYSRLFTWLVNRINSCLKPKSYGKRNTLGILDLYGFENLSTNSLEQLLINYANEKLQNALIDVTLKIEQEEYVREGLEWQKIPYFDNEPICELIESDCHGLLSLLEESSMRGVGDGGFASRLLQCRAAHPHLLPHPAPNHFQLRHYAGTVAYDVAGFIEKNQDTLPHHMIRAMYSCDNYILKDLFPEGAGDAACVRGPAPLSVRSRVQLASLRARAGSSSSRAPLAVRCLRADEARRARSFRTPLVRHQLRCQGLLESLQLRRAGYCESLNAGAMVTRYGTLRSVRSRREAATTSCDCGLVRASCSCEVRAARALVRALPIPGAEFAYGRTRVFIRSPRTVFELEALRLTRVKELVVVVQKAWRAVRVRRRHKAANIIIRTWRNYRSTHHLPERRALLRRLAARKHARGLEKEQRTLWAAKTIQTHYVQWMRRRYLCSLWPHLPVGHMSPACPAWPPSPLSPRLAHTHALLRHIHHRWRCYKYRLQFDQTARNRMREKVTASIIFKDRKQNYPRSVSHPFVGDYVRLRAAPGWRRCPAAAADQYVVFADMVNKVARSSGRLTPTLVVISTGALLVLDARSLRIKWRVPAHHVYRLSLSPFRDDLAVVHVRACSSLDDEPCDLASQSSSRDGADTTGCLFGSDQTKSKGDFAFQTCHIIELVTKLFLVVQNAAGRPPRVHIGPEFEANFGQQVVTFVFKAYPPGEARSEQLKLVRKSDVMEVFI